MKAFSIFWSEKAAADLRALNEFISCDKPQSAISFIKRLKGKTQRLKRFPYSGRMVPELSQKEIREIVFENYRIVYKVVSRKVFILTVFESHKNFR